MTGRAHGGACELQSIAGCLSDNSPYDVKELSLAPLLVFRAAAAAWRPSALTPPPPLLLPLPQHQEQQQQL